MRTIKALIAYLFAIFAASLFAHATPLRVQVVDETGAAFPHVLVIVRPLNGGEEVFRALSDNNGMIPLRDLPSGAYQLIATCPYGLCQTTVHEFMVKNEPLDFKLPLAVKPTKGNTATIGHIQYRDIEVEGQQGKPLPSVPILVRDANATNERWYRTGSDGRATIEVPPGTEMTIIALYNGSLISCTSKTDEERKNIVLHFQ